MEKYTIVRTNDINLARKEISKAIKENKKIIVHNDNDIFNRQILENKNVDIFAVSNYQKKSRLKQRESGINQVLCKLAVHNNIKIALDLKILKNKSEKETADIISKMIENIRLFKKYKNKVILLNAQKNKHDLFSLLLSLGMPTDMAKYAVDNSIKE
jgi:RNase P/RNase MRP subunit p30